MIPDHALVLATALVASLFASPIARRIAVRTGFVDRPGGHKQHGRVVPLLGGAAIVIAVLATVLWRGDPGAVERLYGILGGAVLLSIVGVVDDRRSLSVRFRLAVQAVAAGILIASGIRVQLFDVFALDAALTILWCMAVTNAVNFADNMDGLSTGISAIASGAFLVMAAMNGQEELALMSAALCGASLGFLVFNFNPARIFMGDAGSLFIGFVLAAMAVQLRFPASHKGITWMVPPLVLALPLTDLLLVIVSRLRRGVPVSTGGHDHLSHRLKSLGFGTRATVGILYAGCASAAALAVLASVSGPEVAYGAGLLVAAGGLGAIAWFERRPLV